MYQNIKTKKDCFLKTLNNYVRLINIQMHPKKDFHFTQMYMYSAYG